MSGMPELNTNCKISAKSNAKCKTWKLSSFSRFELIIHMLQCAYLLMVNCNIMWCELLSMVILNFVKYVLWSNIIKWNMKIRINANGFQRQNANLVIRIQCAQTVHRVQCQRTTFRNYINMTYTFEEFRPEILSANTLCGKCILWFPCLWKE